MLCTSCFEAILPECPETILVKARLSATTDYYAIVTDKFGTKYHERVTTDLQGGFEFTSDVLPVGSFTRHSGTFELEVRTDLNSCDPEILTFCVDGVETEFLCVIFGFIEMVSDPAVEAIIGCDCPEEV